IPANETFVDIDVLALRSGSGTKTLQAVLKSPYGACSGLGDYLDTAALIISDGYYVDAQPADTTVCSGCSVQLRVEGEDLLNYTWTPVTGRDDPNINEPIASPTNDTQYTVTALPPSGYPCPGSGSSVSINVDPTGMDKVKSEGELQVYPNPFSTGFTINVPEGDREAICELQLFNLLGQVVYQTQGKQDDLNAGLGSIGKS